LPARLFDCHYASTPRSASKRLRSLS
jgi:hypothetical protein